MEIAIGILTLGIAILAYINKDWFKKFHDTLSKYKNRHKVKMHFNEEDTASIIVDVRTHEIGYFANGCIAILIDKKIKEEDTKRDGHCRNIASPLMLTLTRDSVERFNKAEAKVRKKRSTNKG